MKLLCLNIGLFEKNNENIRQLILEQEPDILAFQEVTRSVDGSALAEFVSKGCIDDVTENLSFQFFAPTTLLRKFEQKNFHGHDLFSFDAGGLIEFGNYVKSSCEITHAKNIFVQNCFSYVTDMSSWPQEDYRAVQVVDLQNGGKKFRLLNYHGIWTQHKQGNDLTLEACKIIKNLAMEVKYPVIICGDFNLFPDTPSMQVLSEKFESLVDTYQIQTTRPVSNELHGKGRNVIDYIFVSPGIEAQFFSVPESDASDHLPLILEFDFY